MTKVMDDQELWDRARAGDAAAFGALYERHARAVHEFCFWRTSDAALAEDLCAAVFVEVWAARGRTALSQPSLRPWLFGVAHNLVRNQWRSARRRRAALDRLPPLRDAPDHAETVAERVDAERRMRAVRAAVDRLPRRERDVLELCGWAGLTPAEAAVALKVPVGTVHSRLHRARARLAELSTEATRGSGHGPGEHIHPDLSATEEVRDGR